MKRLNIRVFLFLWAMGCLLLNSISAFADVRDEDLASFVGEAVTITLVTGEQADVVIHEWSDNFVIVTNAEEVSAVIARNTIASMEPLSMAPVRAAPSEVMDPNLAESVAVDAADRATRERVLRRQARRAGRGMIISGSVLLGVGVLFEASALTLALSVQDRSDVPGRVIGSSVAIAYALVGAPFVLAGTGLLAGGIVKRKRANRAMEQQLTYSFTPTFYRDGGGGQLLLRF